MDSRIFQRYSIFTAEKLLFKCSSAEASCGVNIYFWTIIMSHRRHNNLNPCVCSQSSDMCQPLVAVSHLVTCYKIIMQSNHWGKEETEGHAFLPSKSQGHVSSPPPKAQGLFFLLKKVKLFLKNDTVALNCDISGMHSCEHIKLLYDQFEYKIYDTVQHKSILYVYLPFRNKVC